MSLWDDACLADIEIIAVIEMIHRSVGDAYKIIADAATRKALLRVAQEIREGLPKVSSQIGPLHYAGMMLAYETTINWLEEEAKHGEDT